MIALDASLLIAYLDADDHFHAAARSTLEMVSGQPFRASAVTIAEVLVRPIEVGVGDTARRALAELAVEAVGIDVDAPERLASWRVRTKLKLPDCCVLLAAEDIRADMVLSFDHRLRQAAAAAGYEVGPSG